MPSLVRALHDPDHRPLAAKFLGELGYWRSAPRIRPLLGASDEWTRIEAVRALGRMREADTFPDVVNMLSDDSELVRSWVIAALGELRDPRARPMLLDFLKADSWVIRRSAASTLGKFGSADAIEPLHEAMRREPFRRRGVFRRAVAMIEKRCRDASAGEGATSPELRDDE